MFFPFFEVCNSVRCKNSDLAVWIHLCLRHQNNSNSNPKPEILRIFMPRFSWVRLSSVRLPNHHIWLIFVLHCVLQAAGGDPNATHRSASRISSLVSTRSTVARRKRPCRAFEPRETPSADILLRVVMSTPSKESSGSLRLKRHFCPLASRLPLSTKVHPLYACCLNRGRFKLRAQPECPLAVPGAAL